MSLQSNFYKLLTQTECIPVGSRVLVAVSGGADSVALLTLLSSVADSMDLHLEVAHLDHSLRDASSIDAQFVENLCVELGLFLTMQRLDVAGIARERKGNLEEVARNVRRKFLEKTANARHCDLIALGQHLDDQAETFLMRLMRGSGTAGLASMRVRDGMFVRPLLSFSHGEIVDFLQEEGVAWREDESNSNLDFTRNRVRHQLVPTLKSFNPNVSRQLSGLCQQLQQDEDFWSSLVEDQLANCGVWRDDCHVLDRLLLQAMPPALSSRVVRKALRLVRGDLRGISASHIDDILKLVVSNTPQAELLLPGAWVARRYEEILCCVQKPEGTAAFELVINGIGLYELPGGGFLKITEEGLPSKESPSSVEFCAADLAFPLQLRTCRIGDRFQPSGMSGTKKIQDLFVDLKLTKEERMRALLLMNDDHVLWVVGVRRSALVPPVSGQPVLRVVFEP